MAERVLVALGGNAIKRPYERGTSEEQMKNVSNATLHIAEVVGRGCEVVVTHGNGPQVGNLSLQNEMAKRVVPSQPLSILGAMTQGQIGYMIQQNLRNMLREEKRPVVTVVTQTIVDRDDPDFQDPHKPIGPFYSEEEAMRLGREKRWILTRIRPNSDRAWRRVVPSPMPLSIVEGPSIKRMVEAGMIVIASGGGGIPVVVNQNGSLEGVDAVVDKDLAGQVLANEVKANVLLSLTDVEGAKLDYGKPTERIIEHMNAYEARAYLEAGEFPPGSMGPKVESCVRFVEHGGDMAFITSIENGSKALDGGVGTLITLE